ncbi:glycogen synthase GlgA [Angelakisella massiliensis]|uniref:glycogen synthase GlgA n=1 Tax=Angelakisella massiliensis TaxID=1871018 RepID=UPI0023A8AC82|nr:glycogen synthase GlgA [Angelakisella massiliensis]
MKILYAASEALPFIASGGLADVAGSLPAALKKEGAECRVVMPLYGDIKPELREKMRYVTHFNVPLAWRNQYCGLFEAEANNVKYYLLDNEYYFKRSGIYGFYDDAERFVFFSKAILEMLTKIDYAPDIINCNDWQTAMVPVFLNIYYRSIEKFRGIRTVFTIHNIAYQGKYGMEIATDIAGLPDYALPIVEYDHNVNMMKGAIDQSDVVSTVSPTYAEEILDSWFGFGLDRILREKRYKLCGILNGIDVKSYDPATDPEIYKNYTVKTAKDKGINKAELQKQMGLNVEPDKPLVAMVSRLVGMKGLDLVRYIFDSMIAEGIQFVVLGTGDYIYENFFAEMAARYPGTVAVRKGFVPDLARKIYAGADILLMPSKSEPCGLAQMVALRYGTIPIIRETGGLKDSIQDLGGENGNGYTFKTYNAHDMLGAVKRAVGLYRNPDLWQDAVCHAMECDFSWQRSAKKYMEMYQRVLGMG